MSVITAEKVAAAEWFVPVPIGWLRLPSAELKVAVTLLSYADATATCWPRYEAVAERAGIHRRSVIRLIERLEMDRKLLHRETRRHRSGAHSSNRYRLNLTWKTSVVTSGESPQVDGVRQDDPDQRQGCQIGHPGVTEMSLGGDKNVTRGCQKCHPELDPIELDPKNSLSKAEDRFAVGEGEPPTAELDPNRQPLSDPTGLSAAPERITRGLQPHGVQPEGPSAPESCEAREGTGPECRAVARRRGELPSGSEALPWEGADGQLDRSFVEYVIRALPKKADVAESRAMARAFLRRARQDAERLLAVEDLWEDYRRPRQLPPDPHAQQLAAIAAALSTSTCGRNDA